MITLEDYLMGRTDGLTPLKLANATETVQRWNMLLSYYYEENPGADRVTVRSGYRTAEINANTVGSAPNSAHMTCQAMDGSDDNRAFAKWCVKNQSKLAIVGLWMEEPRATPNWVHLQTRSTHARIFFPDADWAARLNYKPVTEETL